MTPDLSNLNLRITDGPNISLHDLHINWDKFNLECVKYFKKYAYLNKKSINLKSILEVENDELRVTNRYQDWAIRENSNDIFLRIIQYDDFTNKNCEKGDNLLGIKFYNPDLLNEYPYIPKVLDEIQSYTGLKFNNIKLSYLLNYSMQPIHIDWDDKVYHLPIVTNDNVFFCEGNKVYSMLDSNKLYILNTNIPHTVLNTSGSLSRLHLIAHPYMSYQNSEIDQKQQLNAIEIDKTFYRYLRYAKNYMKNTSAADLELNSELFKKIKLILLKYAKHIKNDDL